MSTTNFVDILAQLLPPVSYDQRAEQLRAELAAAAEVLVEVLSVEWALGLQLQPLATTQLLPEFEADYGLPDVCDGAFVTVGERRLAVLSAIRAVGGQTAVYFERLALALGYSSPRVREYRQITCTSKCDAPLAGPGWLNVWALTVGDAQRVTVMKCTSPCNEPLANWALIESLQCMVNRLKPAHTICLFKFGG